MGKQVPHNSRATWTKVNLVIIDIDSFYNFIALARCSCAGELFMVSPLVSNSVCCAVDETSFISHGLVLVTSKQVQLC